MLNYKLKEIIEETSKLDSYKAFISSMQIMKDIDLYAIYKEYKQVFKDSTYQIGDLAQDTEFMK